GPAQIGNPPRVRLNHRDDPGKRNGPKDRFIRPSPVDSQSGPRPHRPPPRTAMTRIERKLLVQTAIFGVCLTTLVVVADQASMLEPIERWFYDRRCKDCQFFSPPPTDKLVHVDITDESLQTIGHWP